MTEQLPISIHVCDDFKQQFKKAISICNKFEAQFNFQTMTANWYDDENNILFLQLYLETPKNFTKQQTLMKKMDIKTYSDDVFSYYKNKKNEQKLLCHIAITDSELALLSQQNKLLAGLLQVKLKKVLNLIAHQLILKAI